MTLKWLVVKVAFLIGILKPFGACLAKPLLVEQKLGILGVRAPSAIISVMSVHNAWLQS
jgi:hypothetical protein